MELLDHLKSDKASADDRDTSRVFYIEPRYDSVHIRDITQRKNARQVEAGDRWL
jgi:hypothetical protein